MLLRVAAAAAALFLASSAAAFADDATLTFPTWPQNHSGELGYVTMVQDGPDLVVAITTVGGDLSLKQPDHIHKNTCATLDPKPAYPFMTIVDGESVTTIHNLTIAQLQSSNYAVNIHHSTTDAALYVSCADIPKS